MGSWNTATTDWFDNELLGAMPYGKLKHCDNGLLGAMPYGKLKHWQLTARRYALWEVETFWQWTARRCVQHKLPAPHHPHQKWQGSLERNGEEWISVCDCHHLLFGYLCFTIHHLLLSCYVVSTVCTFVITRYLSEVSCMYNCLCLLLSDPLSRISETI